jgi:hypothetical protein
MRALASRESGSRSEIIGFTLRRPGRSSVPAGGRRAAAHMKRWHDVHAALRLSKTPALAMLRRQLPNQRLLRLSKQHCRRPNRRPASGS